MNARTDAGGTIEGPASRGLSARGIVVQVDESVIVAGVDLDVPRGGITALVGPNGAGKSTLFDCLSGVLPATAGRILLDGHDVTRATPDERSRRGLARTFQHSSVFPTLTVHENLLVGAEHRSRLGLLRALLRGRSPDEMRTPDIVDHVLSRLGLRAIRHVPARTLPTGTLRLVEIGRALCTAPTVLLLDEPASGLDDAETEHLLALLVELAGEGLAVLLVEHDLALVRAAAQHVYALAEGRVLASGTAAEVLSSASVLAVVTGTAVGGAS